MKNLANERGYILPATLASLFAMSLVAVTLVGVSSATLKREVRQERDVQRDLTLQSAILAAAMQVTEDPSRRRLKFLDNAETIEIGDTSIAIRVTWESARLDANRADQTALEQELRTIGTSPEIMQEIATRLQAARAAQRPLEMIEALDLSPGALACANELLTTFGGRNEARIDSASALQPIGQPTPGSRIRMEAWPKATTGGKGLTAVLLVTGDPQKPVRVLDWRPRRGDAEEACHGD